jgi:hypothetical protein
MKSSGGIFRAATMLASRVACGAALYNLRLALQGCGVRPLVTLPADPERPDLLASVRFGGRNPSAFSFWAISDELSL